VKRLFALLALATSCAFAAPVGVTYTAEILKVKDGDTVVIAAPFLPAPLKPELSVRIYGVDTPEKNPRAQCPEENKYAQAATRFTTELIQRTKDHKVVLIGWDKYGGRVLGDLILDGHSLREALISSGLAREYFGDAKLPWCKLA
jgi:micrococcal nuclease